MKLQNRLIASVALVLALTSCNDGSNVDVGDAAGLSEVVAKRVDELGGAPVAELSISTSNDTTGGMVSVLKSDGSIATGSLSKGEASGLTATPTAGLALNEIPFDVLVATHKSSTDACNKRAVTTVFKTQTGKVFVNGTCNQGKITPATQVLDGTEVKALTSLESATDFDMVLKELQQTIGVELTELTVSFTRTEGDEPGLRAIGKTVSANGQKCDPRFGRSFAGIAYTADCDTAAGGKKAFSIDGLTGQKLAAALQQGMKQVGATSTDELLNAAVELDDDGTTVLTVASANDSKLVQVPLG